MSLLIPSNFTPRYYPRDDKKVANRTLRRLAELVWFIAICLTLLLSFVTPWFLLILICLVFVAPFLHILFASSEKSNRYNSLSLSLGVMTCLFICKNMYDHKTEHDLKNLPNEKIAAINDSLANTPQATSYKYADSIIANKQQENAAIQELARETNARNIPVNSILSSQGISDINRAVELENIRRKSVKDTANLDTLTQKSNINDLVKVMVALQTANPTDSAMIYNNIFKTPKSQKVLTQWQQSSDLTNGKTGKKLQALQKEFDQNNQLIAKQRPAIQRYDSVKKDITAHFDKVYAVKRDSLLKKLGKDVKQKQK